MSAPTPSAPLSHCPIPYSVGQWDKTPERGTGGGTGNEPASLKALAAKVLLSVPRGTNYGTFRETDRKQVGQNADFAASFVPPPKHSAPGENGSDRSPIREDSASIPADASNLEALAAFERDPRGVIAWLGQQKEGQPAHLLPRWAAAIQAEARRRLAEMAELTPLKRAFSALLRNRPEPKPRLGCACFSGIKQLR